MQKFLGYTCLLFAPSVLVSGACADGGTSDIASAGAPVLARGGAPVTASGGAGASSGSAGALASSGANASGAAAKGGAGSGMGGGAGAEPFNTNSPFAKLLSRRLFEEMFPDRGTFYTYASLIEAADSFPDFASDGSDAAKREAAAFLANVERETLGLVYADEIIRGVYCAPSPECPCAEGKSYWGRGALQLSWNYNYCAAGQALGLPLQSSPELVSAEPKLAWRTALWFWMTQTSATSHTPHQAIQDTGFGETIRIINGGIECNGPTDPGVQAAVQQRKTHYLLYTSKLGVAPGGPVDC